MKQKIYLQPDVNALMGRFASAISYVGLVTASNATPDTIEENIRKIAPTISFKRNVVIAQNGNGLKVEKEIPAGTIGQINTSWSEEILTVSQNNSEGYVGSSEKETTVSLSKILETTYSPKTAPQRIFSAGQRVYFAGDYYVDKMPDGSQGGISKSWNGATLSISQRNAAGYVPTNAVTATETLTTVAGQTHTPGISKIKAFSAGDRVYFSGNYYVDTLGGNAQAKDVIAGHTFSSNATTRNIPGQYQIPAYNTLTKLTNLTYKPFENTNGTANTRWKIDSYVTLSERPDNLIVEYHCGTKGGQTYTGAMIARKNRKDILAPQFPDAWVDYTDSYLYIYTGSASEQILMWIQVNFWKGTWNNNW